MNMYRVELHLANQTDNNIIGGKSQADDSKDIQAESLRQTIPVQLLPCSERLASQRLGEDTLIKRKNRSLH